MESARLMTDAQVASDIDSGASGARFKPFMQRTSSMARPTIGRLAAPTEERTRADRGRADSCIATAG